MKLGVLTVSLLSILVVCLIAAAWVMRGSDGSLDNAVSARTQLTAMFDEIQQPRESEQDPRWRASRPETGVSSASGNPVTDPFLSATGYEDLLSNLVDREDTNPGVDNYQHFRWMKACQWAWSYDQQSRPAARGEVLGLKETALVGLVTLCQGALPESVDLADSIDTTALREWADDMFFESSVAFVTQRLEEWKEARGLDAAIQEALRIIAESLDEGALVSALDFLVVHRLVAPPFPDVEATYFMYDPELMMMVATALVCNRIGGCRGTHPLTLRRCFESRHGCYRPVDFYHAVEQTTPPLEFEAFLRLQQEATGLAARHGLTSRR